MSFSDEKRRKSLEECAKIPVGKRTKDEQKFAKTYENMVEVENRLSGNGLIPPQFKLLLTTSRNKEGINIKSEDINDVFVESHNMSDIIQMAGRVRHGAENLYIIVNSCGHSDDDYPYEDELAIDELAPDARDILKGKSSVQDGSFNRHLLKLCNTRGFQNFFANRISDFCPFRGKQNLIRQYIKLVHDMTDFVRFDHFCNHFWFYYLKTEANRYLKKQHKQFKAASQDHAKYVTLFQKAFPDSVIHPYKDRIDLMREYIELQLAGNPKREFTKEQIDRHIAELNSIRFDCPDDYLQQPKSLLAPIGLTVKRVCNDPQKPGYKRLCYVQAAPQQHAA